MQLSSSDSFLLYCAVLALGVAAALFWLCRRARGIIPGKTLALFALLALPLAFFLSWLGICLVSQGWYLFGNLSLWDLSHGRRLLYGAVGGVVLAAALAAKGTGESFGKLLDALSAPGMLLVAVCRFSEGLLGIGYGRAIEDWFDPWGEYTFFPLEDPEPFLRFPFGVPDYYGDYHFSVFLLEGLAALVILALLLKRRGEPAGSVFLLALMLYASAQTTLESLRADSLPKWGFVRVSQLLSGVLAAFCLFRCSVLGRGRGVRVSWGPWAGLAGCIGMILVMEFAVEKKILFLQWMRMDLCYFVMALSSLALFLLSLRVWKKTCGL